MKHSLRHASLLLCLLFIFQIGSAQIHGATSKSFTDVSNTDWFSQDVQTLVGMSAISGYTDGKFRPYNNVTVAEFLKIVMAATDQVLIESRSSSWYSPYVDTAKALGYIDPYYFKDYTRPITRGEICSIIDNILQLDYSNTHLFVQSLNDYTDIDYRFRDSCGDVYMSGIMTGYLDKTIRADALASRAEATTLVIRMLDESRRRVPVLETVAGLTIPLLVSVPNVSESPVSIDGVDIGMNQSQVVSLIGNPSEVLPCQYGYDWWVYPGDYSDFKLIGVKNDKVVSLFSNIQVDTDFGIGIGSSESTLKQAVSVADKGDFFFGVHEGLNIKYYSSSMNSIEAIWATDSTVHSMNNITADTIQTMEKLLLHLINGSRVKNGLSSLKWCPTAHVTAYNHSVDMAINDYFAHTNLRGKNLTTE